MSNSHPTRHHSKPPLRRPSWCCSFSLPPRSPQENPKTKPKPKPDPVPKPAPSFPNSPQTRSTLVNRILSPGRVSPIDPLQGTRDSSSKPSEDVRDPPPPPLPLEKKKSMEEEGSSGPTRGEGDDGEGVFDVRLSLKGKRGGCLVLELNSGVLSANSSVFADLIGDYRNGGSGGGVLCRIEVPDVDNLFVFRETIELMFEGSGEDGITRRLLKFGVYKSIDILEVSASIKFARGVCSCLKYIEAVPWSEEEEERVRNLFGRYKFDDAISRDILARFHSLESDNAQQNLTRQLVRSITSSTDANARNELKSLVKGLLQKSSIYESTHPYIEKADLYAVCHSCLESLIILFEEASGSESSKKVPENKPLVERVSLQVDNINWLLEIMLDQQIAEEFVNIWAEQKELLKMHESTSQMVRYELSRVSATLFIAIGSRKLHCRSEMRLNLLRSWFGPMLSDFGWLQRCKKGLEMKVLEESMGQSLLTLPLKNQYSLFMEWFQCFSKQGNECPNLSKAFQIWWRRSFLRGSESHAIESR